MYSRPLHTFIPICNLLLRIQWMGNDNCTQEKPALKELACMTKYDRHACHMSIEHHHCKCDRCFIFCPTFWRHYADTKEPLSLEGPNLFVKHILCILHQNYMALFQIECTFKHDILTTYIYIPFLKMLKII